MALMLFVGNANAQLEFPEDKVSWDISLEQDGCDATIVVKVTCVEHWHVYAANLPEGSFLLPTEVEPDKSDKYTVVGKVIEPKPEFIHDEAADEDIYQHSNSFTLKRKIKVNSKEDFTLKGYFAFQTCDETHCLQPYSTDFSLKVKGCATNEKKGAVFEAVEGVADDATGLDFAEDKVDWKFSVEQDGCNAFLVAEVTCAEHWHVSAANLPEGSLQGETWLEPNESTNYKLVDKLTETEPEFFHDDAADEDIYQHSKTFTLKQKIEITSKEDFVLKGKYGFTTCNEEGFCLPPHSADFEVEVKGCADADVLNIANNSSEVKEDQSLWAIFIEGLIGGLLALFMPCIYPMLPLTVSFFMKQSKTKSEGIRKAIIYGISIIFIYVALGMLVTILFGSDALNAMSTNPWFNVIFFILFVVFAMSFFGAFEITLPSSWANKMDNASNKGGLIGIFFMAGTLAIVSFSCTGPIVGDLLVRAANDGEYFGPAIGMLGFSTSLAIPFALFAIFPSWLNSMPKSGGWLNTLKVTLGFLELALALKFLSNADLVVQGHYLERELFLAIWIGIFFIMTLYLLGVFRMLTDSPNNGLSVTRLMFATVSMIFTIYLIPGLSGAPLKLVSGFPPPTSYSESPQGLGGGAHSASKDHGPEGTHLGAQGLYLFHDLDEGLAYAKKVGKPAMLDFTGWACVNCRAMESNVWGEKGVIDILRNDLVIISLYVDEGTELPIDEQKEVEFAPGKTKMLTTIGNKWSYLQASKYKTNSQPYYRMLGPNGEDLANGSADYQNHGNKDKFKAWLDEGLRLYKEAK